MRDSSGPNTGHKTHPAPAQPAHRTLLLIATIAAVILCSVHAAVAGSDTVPASGIGYLCYALVLFGCAAALWTRERSTHGVLRIRWCLFAAATLADAIGFVPSFTECFLRTGAARLLQTASFNAAEALFMLASVLFFAGVARSVVFLDLLQALVLVVLRFNLIYSPATRDHFTNIHLLVGQLMALLLFLVATVACLGAASRAELRFLRTLAGFFGLRLIAFFTADQVSYIWLHHRNCSQWDVVGDALMAGFALYLLYTSQHLPAEQPDAMQLRRPSLAVRSLMPSFLALVNLMLGLFLLRISIRLAAAAISVTVVSYVVRTALLHAQAAEERAALETRNEHLEGLAVRDPLTGIGNRRSLAGVYANLQEADGTASLSLLLMDIDSFKRANDCHGHNYGDRVLVTLSKKLDRLVARVEGSHSARLGGDEFALLLPDVSPEHASAIAEELRASMSAHSFGEGRRVSLSIGVASLRTARDLPLEALVSHADEALYRAKLMGRDRVEIQQLTERDKSSIPSLHLEFQETAGQTL